MSSATVPSNGAVSACSIFIASSVSKRWPLATFSPFLDLNRRNPPRHRRLDLAVVDAVGRAGAARRQVEFVRIALGEDDDPLLVAESGDRGDLAIVGRGDAELAMAAERDAGGWGIVEPEARETGQRLRFLVDGKRDRRGAAPDRFVGLGVRHQISEVALDEAGVDPSRFEVGMEQAR